MIQLDPGVVPGRANRKAREFTKEIARLRAEGYTLDAIRCTLAKAGVDVSLSTVWRESRRGSQPSVWTAPTVESAAIPASQPPITAAATLTAWSRRWPSR